MSAGGCAYYQPHCSPERPCLYCRDAGRRPATPPPCHCGHELLAHNTAGCHLCTCDRYAQRRWCPECGSWLPAGRADSLCAGCRLDAAERQALREPLDTSCASTVREQRAEAAQARDEWEEEHR